jgi:aspartate kinase
MLILAKTWEMKVYKFGGASVKDAPGIRNLASIVSAGEDNLVIVVSAFGKTTNALEKVLDSWLKGEQGYEDNLDEISRHHLSVIDVLFTDSSVVAGKVEKSFSILREYLRGENRGNYDFEYDQVVSFGELWSTIIVAEYLRTVNPETEWVDIRRNLLTDDRYRDANILWEESSVRIRCVFDSTKKRYYVTQGFIGGTADGDTTTLGREGSDYTAAILANMLDAESVVVWKDVPGILNADPKWLKDAVKLDEISYTEAVEMTFSGAKIIHPKTIKPLHNKNIPLHVRSFIKPEVVGTIIKAEATIKTSLPVYIKKEGQILISISPRDFSFAMGDNLNRVFQLFKVHGIRVNLVEASAVKIDVCVDDERPKIEALISELSTEFRAAYNENTEMLSIRHYTKESVERITSGRDILLEQRTRSTVRFVVRQQQ